MAKSPQQSSSLLDDTLFQVVTPLRHDTVYIDPDDNTIRVAILDFNNDEYEATLYDFDGSFEDPVIIDQPGAEEVPLTREDATSIFSARMEVGLPDESGTGPNRVIEFNDLDTGDSIRHAFRAQHGSGSSGSSEAVTVSAKNFQPGQLIPVALNLKLDSKVTKGTGAKVAELNRPTALLHSNAANTAVGWHSRPIAFGGKGVAAGYWVLAKTSSTVWTLVLKQGEKVLVTFIAKTKPKDCTLPIKLQRKGAGNKVCKAWPKTVTITATA